MTTDDERKFPATHVYALGFWISGFVLVLLDLFTNFETGELGILMAGIGGLLNVRGLLMHLECRERQAFSLGQDVERLRSIN